MQGEPPQDQEPELRVKSVGFHVFNRNQTVFFAFEEPVEYLAMDPRDAIRVGKELIARGQRGLKGKEGRVPKS